MPTSEWPVSTLLTDGKAAVVSTFVCKLPLGTVFNSLGVTGSRGGSVFNS